MGEKEKKEGIIAVRKHGGGDLGTMSVNDFKNLIKTEIDNLITFNN